MIINWINLKGTVSLQLGSTDIIIPTARDIYSIEFKNENRFLDYEIQSRPSEEIREILFSRFPLDIFLIVVPPVQGYGIKSRCLVGAYINHLPRDVSETIFSGIDHVIVDGTWYPLIQDAIDEILALINEIGIHPPCPLTLRQYLSLRNLSSEYISFYDTVDTEGDYPNNDIDTTDISESFTGQLYDYQQVGFTWLRCIANEDFGCILGDEMGLGKTIQVIALLALEKDSSNRPSLIIAPATILENWRREIIKFTRNMKVLIHRGLGRTGFPSSLKQYDLVITSYDTVVNDFALFKMVDWNIVIVDEAQAIKNPETQRTETAQKLPRRVAIAMTGTPVENRLMDLWSIMSFAVPGYLGTRNEFEKKYTEDIDAAVSLEPVISPLILRRLVSEVAKDLPPRIDIPQLLELDDQSSQEYEFIRKEIIATEGTGIQLKLLQKLRMYCTHPLLLSPSDSDPANNSNKYQRLLEIIVELIAREEKVVIFTSFTKMIDIIVADLQDRLFIHVDYIDGRVKVENRQPIIDAFEKIQGTAILVLNPKAAGTGLNITGANHVIHYNLEWNPAVEDQASARVYRRGQSLPVTVHRFYYVNTVEEIINSRIDYKREMAGKAIIGHKGRDKELADIVLALEISPIIKSRIRR